MTTQKLITNCLGHRVEVTINIPCGCDKTYIDIPHTICDIFAEEVECGERRGTFSHVPDNEDDDLVDYNLSGSWRVIDIDYERICRVLAWKTWFGPNEALDKELFIRYYGKRMGQHYFEKWCGHQGDLIKMLAEFHTNHGNGQLFCDMVAEQMLKYEARHSAAKQIE